VPRVKRQRQPKSCVEVVAAAAVKEVEVEAVAVEAAKEQGACLLFVCHRGGETKVSRCQVSAAVEFGIKVYRIRNGYIKTGLSMQPFFFNDTSCKWYYYYYYYYYYYLGSSLPLPA
jgi:hypothetical protein